MKIRTSVALGLLAVGAIAVPAQAAKQHLGAETAEQTAEQLGRTIVGRSPRLQESSLFVCTPVGADAFDCLVEAQGETKREKLECDFQVAVRARPDGNPTARISKHKCRAVEIPYLTRARATQVLEEAFAQIHGPSLPQVPAGIVSLQRVDQSEFKGSGIWLHEISPSVIETCEMKMSARLDSTQAQTVTVQAEEPICRKTLSISG